jgi:pimeloyl-ACP methyl ester carboxylesterase
MPKVRVKGFKMFYEITGKGTPLVMIMGLGANSQWWDENGINQLSKRYKVLIFDNRGTGRSDDPGDKFTLEDLGEDVVHLMDKINISKAHILGISMGGMIAQHIAIHHPERVIKLILSSTYCGGSKSIPPSSQVIKTMSKPREGRPIEEIVNETIPLLYTKNFIASNPEKILKIKENMSKYPISEDNYKRQGKAIFSHNTCDQLEEISIPTLIIHGKKDILIPPKNAEVLHELIPDSEIEKFKNGGHALFTQETDKVLPSLNTFLGS